MILTSNICIMLTIIVYLLGMIYIGVRFSKTNKNTDDFYLGGRKLGPFVTAMSAEASDMSSWLLMGLPGVAYATGLADAAWTGIGLAIGTYLNWLIVSKRIRRYSHMSCDSTTIPALFSNRFRDKSNMLSVIAAVVIIVFFVPYTASGFAACGKLFSSLFGVNYLNAMIVCAVVIVAYTTLGGFLAASTSDFIQSIVMTIALIVVLSYGTVTAGGLCSVIDNAKGLDGYLSLTAIHDATENTAVPYGGLKICSTLAWGLGYFGMPHILLRFMAARDPKELKLSRRIATGWVVISLAVAIFIGIIGLGMTNAGVLESLSDPETIIVRVAGLISQHGALAAVVAGVILAGILAATMSTSDSQLLAASSSVSQNIIKEFLFKNISDKATMIIARVTVVLISVVAVFLAVDPESSVFNIVSFAWAGFGAAFGPAVLMMLFWKRMNKWGALAGMVSGGVMVFVWKYIISGLHPVLNIYELLPAFIVSLVFIIVVSLLTPAPSKEITDEFDRVAAVKN